MPTQDDSGFRTFTSAAALSEGVRVDIDSSGYIEAAGADQRWIGVLQADCASGDTDCNVKLVNAPGTFLMKADVPILTLGSAVYPAANGEVTGISTSLHPIGLLLEATATAALDLVEVALVQAGDGDGI